MKQGVILALCALHRQKNPDTNVLIISYLSKAFWIHIHTVFCWIKRRSNYTWVQSTLIKLEASLLDRISSAATLSVPEMPAYREGDILGVQDPGLAGL